MTSASSSSGAHQRPSAAQIVLLLLLVAFVAALFNHGLVPSMEPRFAEVVREMMATGEYVIPLKNGIPYVEYPVFYYWLAIAGKALGLPMTAAIRLPTFIAFFGWLYVLGCWARLLPAAVPSWGYQLVAAALPIALFQFSIAQTDGPLAFGVMLAMYGYSRVGAEPGKPVFPWALWLGVAIATLSKGPVGLACTLPVLFLDRSIGTWQRMTQREAVGFKDKAVAIAADWKDLCWVRGIGLVLIASVPWYLLAGFQRGWPFVEAVLVYQNVDRYLTGYSHAQPWWYYFKTLLYDFFPVSVLLPVGVWAAWRRFTEPVVRLSLVWALFTFLFFTLSGSKQGKYLLPMAPAVVALAVLAVDHIRRRFNRNPWLVLRLWSIGLIIVFSSLMIFVVPRYSDRIGGVDGFADIEAQLEREPGRLIHFQWPRSLTLYELGAPMAFVRSSRELYEGIRSGRFRPGDYVLVKKGLLRERVEPGSEHMLVPFPRPAVFEVVLETEIDKPVLMLRIRPGADEVEVPQTPEPPVLNWRDAMFDTD